MQRTNAGRRSSILKKRRTRSPEPGNATAQPTPKATRRISFSAKNAVREFRTADKETVWCDSYEESTDKVSNDQITLQSTQSASMCTTRNDTMGMEMTIDSNKPSKMLSHPIEQKENIEFNSSVDMDLTDLSPLSTVPKRKIAQADPDMSLELFTHPMQTKPTAPKQRLSIFSGDITMDQSPIGAVASEQIRKPTQRPTIFDARDISIEGELVPSTTMKPLELTTHREPNNGKGAMSLQSLKLPIQTKKAEPKKRPTIFSEDISIDEDSNDKIASEQIQKPAQRQSIFEVQDISIEGEPISSTKLIEVSNPTRRPTVFSAIDMSLDGNKEVGAVGGYPSDDYTMDISPDISTFVHKTFNNTNADQKPSTRSFVRMNNLSIDMSLGDQLLDNQPKSFNRSKARETVHATHDMTMDTTQIPPQRIQSANSQPNRRTLHEPREMSFDIDGQNRNEKTTHDIHELSVDVSTSPAQFARPTIFDSIRKTRPETEISTDANDRPNNRRTIYGAHEMSMETMNCPPQLTQAAATKSNRRTLHEAEDMSFEDNNRQSSRRTMQKALEMSMDTMHCPPQVVQSATIKSNRQTLYETEDMSFEDIKRPSTRRTVHEPHEMSMDIMNCPPQLLQASTNKVSRQTVHEHRDMSFEANNRPNNRKTVHEALEMSMDTMNYPPQTAQSAAAKSSRRTLHEAEDMSFEDNKRQSTRRTVHKPLEMSMNTMHCPPQVVQAATAKSNRQTIYEAEDMSFEDNKRPKVRRTVYDAHVMTMDTLHCPPQMVQPTTSKINQQTLYEAGDMSFENGANQNNQRTLHGNQAMLSKSAFDANENNSDSDMNSADMSYQMPDEPQQRQSVICKSPGKAKPQPKLKLFDMGNRTALFGNDIDVTQALDSSLHISHHPLHLTQMIDAQLDSSDAGNGESDLSGVEMLDDVKPSANAPRNSHVIFDLPEAATVANISLNSTDSSTTQSTAKAYNLNKTPYYQPRSYYEPRDPSVLILSDESMGSIEKSNSISPQNVDSPVDAGPSTSRGNHTNRKSCIEHTPVKLNESILNDQQSDGGRLAPILQQLQRIDKKRQSMFLHDITACSDDYENVKLDSVHYLTMDNTRVESPSPPMSADLIQDDPSIELVTSIDSANISEHAYDANMESSINKAKISGIEVQAAIRMEKDMVFKSSHLLRHSNIGTAIDESLAQPSTSKAGELMQQQSDAISHVSGASRSTQDTKSQIIDTEIVKTERDQIFKSSRLMRHSNDVKATDVPLAQTSESVPGTSTQQQRQQPQPTEPVASTSNAALNLDDTSFVESRDETLHSLDDIDMSFYDVFHNLATQDEIVNRYKQRFLRILRTMERIEKGEPDDDEPLNSQNVPAPSWTFLWDNKVKCEEEEEQAELARQAAETPVGAFLPVTPNIKISIMNKCRQLENWEFDELWFFEGNISLRHKAFDKMAVTIMYDNINEKIDRDILLYGAMQFSKVVWRIDKPPTPEMHTLHEQILTQELNSKLSKDLLEICGNSTQLSAFDVQVHEYYEKAIEKVELLKSICKRTNGLLKMEDGKVYVKKVLMDIKTYTISEFIIYLDNIDATGWRDVRTLPRRALRDEVKQIPAGIDFITEFLSNSKTYIIME